MTQRRAAACLPVLLVLAGAVPTPAPRPAEQTVAAFTLPAGFKATVFAAEPDVVQPIGLCFDDRGRIWVAECLSYPDWKPGGNDRILVLEDTDGDGRHDKRTVFYDKLNYVTGIEVGFGGVWVVSAPNLLFIPDKDADDKPDGEPEILLDGFGHQGVHNLVNGFTWGPDGWLYGGHGGSSMGDIGPPGAPRDQRTFFDGGVYRYHPVKKRFESFMEGTTNPWGIDFDDWGQAFVSNSVTPHLYHAIQGSHVERRRFSPLSKHAYAVIDTIADHKHYVGAEWNKSGGGKAEQIAVGGGHAHSGCMVYLGAGPHAFPDNFRNTLLMNNIHGDRVNHDLPARNGSGYVARHGPDFLVSGDPWFQGLQLKYGPDGAVYLSDWYDTGECHTRKPHEKTGRIYKITYRSPDPPREAAGPLGHVSDTFLQAELPKRPDSALVSLQLHRNDWHVRRARRLLQERAAGKRLDPSTHPALLKILTENPDGTRKLRALWALHATGGLSPELAAALLQSPDEHVRAWTIQLLCEDRDPPADVLKHFERMASEDPSPRVRLYLASAAGRLSHDQRWPIVERLAARAEDAADPNLPLMVWYAAEPVVAKDPRRAAALIANARLPRLREFAARRLAAGEK